MKIHEDFPLIHTEIKLFCLQFWMGHFGEFVGHRKDLTKMTSHTWKHVFADNMIL